MKGKKILSMLLTAGMLVAAVSCASPEDKEENPDSTKEPEVEYYSGNLSEEEMESGHLTVQLSKNVKVDADITNYSEYKDGLNSYFVNRIQGKKVTDTAAYKKNPTLFGQPLKKVEKAIEEMSDGKFTDAKKKVKKDEEYEEFRYEIPYRTSSGKKKELSAYQGLSGQKLSGADMRFSNYYTAKDEEVYALSESDIAESLLRRFPELDMSDLSFGTKAEVGEKLSDFITDMTGKKLFSQYDCMPVNQINYSDEVKKTEGRQQLLPFTSEYYYYVFYPDVDGFPWRAAHFYRQMGEDEEVPERSDGIDNASEEWAQEIVYGADGIREFTLSNFYNASEIYKEKEEVCSVAAVLSSIQEYLGDSLIPITVYDIQICYTGGFSDPADGKIRDIVKPYWYVRYQNEWAQGIECEDVWVDVATGECYTQGMRIFAPEVN